jgi:hypothetical protein
LSAFDQFDEVAQVFGDPIHGVHYIWNSFPYSADPRIRTSVKHLVSKAKDHSFTFAQWYKQIEYNSAAYDNTLFQRAAGTLQIEASLGGLKSTCTTGPWSSSSSSALVLSSCKSIHFIIHIGMVIC